MKSTIKYLILLLSLSSIKVFAQENKIFVPKFTFSPAPGEDIPDSITLAFRKGALIRSASMEIQGIKPSSDGSFSFSPSFLQPIYWFEIIFYYKNKDGKKQLSGNEDFYAEQNDSINVVYKKALGVQSDFSGVLPKMLLAFSGNGATKYGVANSLMQIKVDLQNSLNKNLQLEFGNDEESKNRKVKSNDYHNSAELKSFLLSVIQDLKLANSRTQDTLTKYKTQISNNITSFFSYELSSSQYFSVWMDYLYHLSNSNNFKKAISNFYFANKSAIIKEPNDEFIKYSFEYKFNTLAQIMYETGFRFEGRDWPFQVQYDAIKQFQNKETRDILTTIFLSQPWFKQHISDRNSRDSCLRDALTFVKSPELRLALNDQFLFSNGSIVPDFSFADIEGKKTGLKDLRGNVFLIDFYFYGCAGCIQFAKRFKEEIYPQFINDQNFKSISVSIDKTKEHWKLAMNSGLYNEKSSINLSTDGLEWKDPFLKQYNVESFPFILLVDKEGKLISKIDRQSSIEINSLIRKALDKGNSK